jgi:hypothetical protein
VLREAKGLIRSEGSLIYWVLFHVKRGREFGFVLFYFDRGSSEK